MDSFKKQHVGRWTWALVLVAVMLLVGVAGYGSARLGAQVGACPTQDACFRHNCAFACKTNYCDAGPDCPDPGQQGTRCYVCARHE